MTSEFVPKDIEELIRESNAEIIYRMLVDNIDPTLLQDEISKQKIITEWFETAFINAKQTDEQETGTDHILSLYQLLNETYRKAEKALPVGQTTQLITHFRKTGNYEALIDVFQDQLQEPLSTGLPGDSLTMSSEILWEFALVAFNKTKQLDSAITLAALAVAREHNNGEIYAASGSAYRRKWEESKDPKDLERSLQAYRTGFLFDFEFYPGINVVYNLLYQGKSQEASKFARLVDISTKLAGGLQSNDYWCLVTQAELACILNKPQEAVNDLMQRLRKHTDTPSYIASSLPTIKRLREQRQEAGEPIETFDRVIAGLEALATADLQEEISIKKPTVEDQLSTYFFHYQGLAEGSVASFVRGNICFGGQLHAHLVSRADVRIAKTILDTLYGLTFDTDLSVFNEVVDEFIRTQFGTEDLEDLHGKQHKEYDQTHQGSHAFFQINGNKEGLTSLSIDLMLGLGDCRQHAYNKELMFGVWKRTSIMQLMREAKTALDKANEEKFDQTLEKIESLLDLQMYVADVNITARVQTNGMYDLVLHEDDPVASDAWQEIELHAMNIAVRDGKIYLADSFYQKHYTFGWQTPHNPVCTIDEFLTKRYIPAGALKVYNLETESCEFREIRLVPASFSGKRDEKHVSNYGGLMIREFPVAVPDDLFLSEEGRKRSRTLRQLFYEVGKSSTERESK